MYKFKKSRQILVDQKKSRQILNQLPTIKQKSIVILEIIENVFKVHVLILKIKTLTHTIPNIYDIK